MIVGLGMVAFLGFLGLALDGASAYLEQQNLQKAADLAALSATWGYYHASYQEQDGYGSPYNGIQAAGKARDATLGANRYAGVTQTTAYIDASGGDIPGADACQADGTNCPTQPWLVRGVRVHLSKVLPTQVLQAIGVGSSTITADARAELGPNTGARQEAPLLLQNCNAIFNLPRVNPYAPGPCASPPGSCAANPADGFRYPMSTDCRPSTRRSWSLGQPIRRGSAITLALRSSG
ncbi:MAG TPA: Tad domain-containing protein, partial [Candidatus Dormibacteraeota bacterium]|nr:Tad domain-containing protein [Candidatus Dormibacteraeota bacterium]